MACEGDMTRVNSLLLPIPNLGAETNSRLVTRSAVLHSSLAGVRSNHDWL